MATTSVYVQREEAEMARRAEQQETARLRAEHAAARQARILEEDRQFHERMDAMRESMLARQEAEQRAVWGELAGAVDPALHEALRQAQAALASAQGDTSRANQALLEHKARTPTAREQVATWARTKGQLDDELSAYQAIEEQARAGLASAHQALQVALSGAWLDAMRQAQATHKAADAEVQEAIAEAERALATVRADGQQRLTATWGRVQLLQRQRPGQG